MKPHLAIEHILERKEALPYSEEELMGIKPSSPLSKEDEEAIQRWIANEGASHDTP